MKRVKDLISDVRIRYPADDFFAGVEISLESSLVRDHYNAYEKAFEVLDSASWTILKRKAISHFNDERSGQRKQAFFNVLNEAFACEWLMHHGFSQVKVIAEDRKRTPDISYVDGTEVKFCEVKTIGISDDEIFRRSSQKVFDGSAYLNLSPGFLNMLRKHITNAKNQIYAVGLEGLAYIFIRFDDIALDYYEQYRNQLIEFCNRENLKGITLVRQLGREIIHC